MKKNKVLSILLALTLLLGLLPAVTPPAQAADYVQPKFAAQPADVYMPEGGTGVLTWAFDVDPSECIEPELYLSATGYWADLLKGYYEAADHSRLKLQKEMSVRLNYTYAPLETSYAITNVFQLLLYYKTPSGEKVKVESDHFTVNTYSEEMPRFTAQPTNVYMPEGGSQVLSWSFNVDPATLNDPLIVLTTGDGDYYDVKNGKDQAGSKVAYGKNMSLRVDSSFVSGKYYRLCLAYFSGGKEIDIYSDYFRITEAADYAQPQFVVQPQSVSVAAGGTGVLTWAFDTDPSECINPIVFLVSSGGVTRDLVKYFRDKDGNAITLKQEMSLRVGSSFVDEKAYRIALAYDTPSGETVRVDSDPFYITKEMSSNAPKFTVQPQSVAVPNNGDGYEVLTWAFDMDPGVLIDPRVYLDCEEITYAITADQSAHSYYRDADNQPVRVQQEMSLRVNNRYISEDQYRVFLAYDLPDGSSDYVYSDYFTITDDGTVPKTVYPFFEEQPQSVTIPAGGTATISWKFEVDPNQCIDPYICLVRGNYSYDLLAGSYPDGEGNPVAYGREMSLKVDSRLANANTPCRICATCYSPSLGATTRVFSDYFYIRSESVFTEQPESYEMPTEEYERPRYEAWFSWTVNFEPADNDTYYVTGGRFGDDLYNLYEYFDMFDQENGGAEGPAVNRRKMVLVIFPVALFDSKPYYIVAKDPNGIYQYSEPFYFTKEGMLRFEELPQDVLLDEEGNGTLTWKTNTDPPETDSWIYRFSGGIYGGPFKMKDTVAISKNMSVPVDSYWASDEPYEVQINHEAAGQNIPCSWAEFYVRQGVTVTFVTNLPGKSIPDQLIASGTCAAQPVLPAVTEGATFGGWYTDEACTAPYDFAAPVTGSLTLYAKWNPVIYYVSFNALGGAPVPAPQKVAHGMTVTRPEDPSREPAAFEGWYIDYGCTRPYDFTAPVTGDLILYAKWTWPVYNVTFYNKGLGVRPDPQRILWGKTVLQPADLTEDGWIFEGWSTDSAGVESYDFSTPVTSDLKLYAKWRRICAVTFVPNGGTGSMEPDTCPSGWSYTVPACGFLPPEGYRFRYWNVSILGGLGVSPGREVVISNDAVFTPNWQPIVYRTITFDMQGHGLDAPTAELRVELNGVPAEPPSPSEEGWEFTGWYTTAHAAKLAISANLFDFTKPLEEDTTLYAGWRDTTVYRIDLYLEGEGNGTVTLVNETEAFAAEGESIFYARANDRISVQDITPDGESVLRSIEWKAIGGGIKDITGTMRFVMPASQVMVSVIFDRKPDAHPHTAESGNLVHVAAKQFTCEDDGWLEHYECSVCGKWFSYDDYWDEYDPIPKADPWFMEKTGHNPGEPVLKIIESPTCTEEGFAQERYYCQNEHCNKEDHFMYYSQVVVPATGHDWGSTRYYFDFDNYCGYDPAVGWLTAVYAERFCQNDPGHFEREYGELGAAWMAWPATCEFFEDIRYLVTFENPAFEPVHAWEPSARGPLGHKWDDGTWTKYRTCEEEGIYTYTCTREGCGKKHEFKYPAMGHSWQNPTYTWNDDHTQVTAETCCVHDSAHVRTETADVVYTVQTAPTCTAAGVGVYKAAFTVEPFTEQVTAIPLPATGHIGGAPKVENVKAPGCETEGSYDTVTYCTTCGEEISRTTETLPAVGHEWGTPVWTWTATAGGYTASALFTCTRDNKHTSKVNAAVTSVRTEPVNGADGSIVYTAKVNFGGTDYTDTKTVVLPATTLKSCTLSGGKATVTLTNPKAGQVLYLASYTASGQMLEIFTVPVQANRTDYSVTLAGTGAYVKAFLTDGDVKPLCVPLKSN